ncbi:hypothetical protein [Flavobacterium sp. Root420]|uniref:hypothetical protein n=1 Tax=Flavobacterium sp. Root420 TaxID=1736533 RepID=UPI0006FE7F7E|nr:hypothetical protein [Flavobacterium sp. Root420]KQX00768.1 hypothetical protein ASC72_07855 [Flavobacterium sp. Root420]
MTTLLQKIEKTESELEFVESKMKFPQVYNSEDIEEERKLLNEKHLKLKEEAIQITEINSLKELLYRQLSEYIETLEKFTDHPYSKSQSLSFSKFYTSPLTAIQDILFSNLKGISGVNLNTTQDPKDIVTDKDDFVVLLKQKRKEFFNAENLYDINLAYRNFSKEVKKFR